MALFVSYVFLSLSGVTLSDILYLKHPRDKATTPSVILHFSTGSICYKNPNNDSSVPIKVNCSFPENLCFKFDKKTEDNEQVTIQGCISADQCRQFDDQHLQCCKGDLCNNSKCHGYIYKCKTLLIYAHSKILTMLQNRDKLVQNFKSWWWRGENWSKSKYGVLLLNFFSFFFLIVTSFDYNASISQLVSLRPISAKAGSR